MGEMPLNWSIAIEEYKAAQDSAQHHDDLLWKATALIWGGNFVLLGFVENALRTCPHRLVIPLTCILGLVFTVAGRKVVYLYNSLNNVKYKRCKEIEANFGMKQHLMTENSYPKHAMKRLYDWVSGLILLAWLLFLLQSICPRFALL